MKLFKKKCKEMSENDGDTYDVCKKRARVEEEKVLAAMKKSWVRLDAGKEKIKVGILGRIWAFFNCQVIRLVRSKQDI